MGRMPMRAVTTSAQRSYRYARIGIVAATAMLGVGVAAVWITVGPLASISALYYTPARTIFTGVLFALSLALVTMAGHSLEQLLLQLAALWAPLIAIIPTPVRAGDVPGLVPECAPQPCVPAMEAAGVQLGLLTLAVIGVGAVITAAIVARRGQRLTLGTVLGLLVAAAMVVGMSLWQLLAPEAVLAAGHVVASGAFFALMTAVAVTGAIAGRGRLRVVYVGVAIAMAAFVVFLTAMFAVVALGVHLGFPWVLVGEGGLVCAFVVLWIAQTVERWSDVDPAVVAGISSDGSR